MIGLVIWPVARRNLAEFLDDLDCLGECIHTTELFGESELDEDVKDVVDILTAMLPPSISFEKPGSLTGNKLLYHCALQRLCTSFVCLAHAILWLHTEDVRHKDIKSA